MECTSESRKHTCVTPSSHLPWVKGSSPGTNFELFSALQDPWVESGFICKGCHNNVLSQTPSLNNSHLFFSHSCRHGPKNKMSAGLVSSESSLHGSQMVPLSLCPHVVIALCACTLGVSLCVLTPHKDTSQLRLGPTLAASF